MHRLLTSDFFNTFQHELQSLNEILSLLLQGSLGYLSAQYSRGYQVSASCELYNSIGEKKSVPALPAELRVIQLPVDK